ncbi:hypothetical protein F2P56_008271 [Juglans regia]|uniref:PPM-type phosphatase domain-containing protein n=2 Tax=Juglans regia TaxID=51240 RepID=A0A834D0W1_JUGRE|nr:probable protein phosphatase 2C 73 isoform X2 [Juglans regia]KAF5471483.1 hypothetical protein F2P56_008271 [Juglans regia]
MGACCTKDGRCRGFMGDLVEWKEDEAGEEIDIRRGSDAGDLIRLKGSSSFTSMYTQQGRKGINQDAMTVWEDLSGEKEMFFCGVFDGHGPQGHRVAHHVRDNLPSKLSAALKISQRHQKKYSKLDVDVTDTDDDSSGNCNSRVDIKDRPRNPSSQNISLASWEGTFVKSFKETDEELCLNSSIDSFCSGTTAVTIVKQGHHLIIANLGDSRAVLCTRGDNNQLLPIQLTVDLKPDVPSEAERIMNCRGRVFAVEGQPDVYRIWMPDEDCPGLAMSRAFGDFCLKDCGLISVPEVSYRNLTIKDEFVVLATDGVWDVLTNDEVIKIVSSAKKPSMAAKLLVNHAVTTWRCKYPSSKVDDCTVICLFLKTKPISEVTPGSVNCSS